MRIHLPVLALLTLVAAGCPRTFDPALSGPLTFSYEVRHGESITRYSGTIPAQEAAEILRQLVPRDGQYRSNLMQRTTEAILEYNGGKTSVKWTQVKLAKRVLVFTVRGGDYVLEEPYSLAFQELLSRYGDRVPEL